MVTALTQSDRASQVLDQAITVDLDWWNSRLDGLGGPLSLDEVDTGKIRFERRDVFAHANAAQESPEGALRLLWYSMAWGAGKNRRLCDKRVQATRSGGTTVAEKLVLAAQRARHDPVGAYEIMRPGGRNLIPYLGPAFFTKFLYFAGSDHPDNGSIILDARVATSLRTAGWHSLGTASWPASAYERYLRLLSRWRDELSTRLERPIALDELEKWLFEPYD